MKPVVILSAAVLSLATLLSLRSVGPEKPSLGAPPPEIDAEGWFNHIGAAPTLANLRGQTVLIEFWATWCPPCVAAWPHLQELHDQYASKGLVILGLSDETPEKVGAFVDENGYTARIAHGSHTSGKYGVTGIPATFIVGPDGKLVWSGRPSELNSSILENALKGAKPRNGGMLAFAPSSAAGGRIAGQLKACEDGKIGKAHAALLAFAADEKASETERTDAAALAGEIETHVAALMSQAERFTKARDVFKSVAIYDALAKEFGAAKTGSDAKAKADEIRKDATLAKELAAAEAFEKMRESTAKLGTSKARDKWKDFAEKYKGTRAGERANAIARPSKS